MSRPRKLYLPAAPLLEYVERHGGVTTVLTDAGVEVGSDNHRTKEYHRALSMMRRARDKGRFDLFLADAFVIEMFGIHPVNVWPDWYEIPENEVLQHRLSKPQCADTCCKKPDDAADDAA